LPKRQVARFLWQCWRGRGSVDADEAGFGRISLRSTNAELLRQVSRLLLRFGISSASTSDALHICDCDDQRRFLQEIGAPGLPAARMLRLVLSQTKARRLAAESQPDLRIAVEQVSRSGGAVLAQVTETLAAKDLEVAATNDVGWDRVVSVESNGLQEVFDATVLGTHNFIADGISVHNSIEQDADMVVLLHREDLYERESPRAGEADFIVAKHRNGPTATITVAFQGHYSRFVDMAQS
jgi:replicative DNA helicase